MSCREKHFGPGAQKCKLKIGMTVIPLTPYGNTLQYGSCWNFKMYVVYKYGLVMRAIVQNICPREFG